MDIMSQFYLTGWVRLKFQPHFPFLYGCPLDFVVDLADIMKTIMVLFRTGNVITFMKPPSLGKKAIDKMP